MAYSLSVKSGSCCSVVKFPTNNPKSKKSRLSESFAMQSHQSFRRDSLCDPTLMSTQIDRGYKTEVYQTGRRLRWAESIDWQSKVEVWHSARCADEAWWWRFESAPSPSRACRRNARVPGWTWGRRDWRRCGHARKPARIIAQIPFDCVLNMQALISHFGHFMRK